MNLEEIHRNALAKILSEYIPNRGVYLVGSRANGTAGRFSDIDLLIEGNIPLAPERRAALRMALEESDLPYRTDLIEEHALSPGQRKDFLTGAVRLLPQKP